MEGKLKDFIGFFWLFLVVIKWSLLVVICKVVWEIWEKLKGRRW